MRTAPLAATLIEALRARATGELRIDAKGGTSRIYFRNGLPCGAQIFFGFKPLGQFLLELGWIDIVALERSLAAVVDGRKQGEALVELGYLTPERLQQGLALHHQRHIRTLAEVAEGTYVFRPSSDLPSWTEELRLSPHRAIVDALATNAGDRVTGRILSRIPEGLGVRLRSGWERYVTHFHLDAKERAFLDAIDRPALLEALQRSEALPEAKARALMAALLFMGVLLPSPLGDAAFDGAWGTPGPGWSTPGPKSPGPRPISQGPIAQSAGPRSGQVEDDPFGEPDALSRSQRGGADPFGGSGIGGRAGSSGVGTYGSRPGTYGSGVGTYGSRPGGTSGVGTHTSRLGSGVGSLLDSSAGIPRRGVADSFGPPNTIPPGNTSSAPVGSGSAVEVDPFYEEPAKKTPPPPTQPDVQQMEAQMRAAQEEARRIRLEREAAARAAREEALKKPLPTFKSDEREARERRARLLKRAFGNLMGGVPEPPARIASFPDLGDPNFATWLEERLVALPKLDHFERLGVSRNASRDQIKQAFFDAAKRYHPDRVPAAGAHLSPKVKELFAAINESYHLLIEDEKRAAYLESLQAPAAAPPVAQGPTPEQIEESERLEKLAQASIRNRSIAEARRLLLQAQKQADRPELRAHLAYVGFLDKGQDSASTARTELEQIVQGAPDCTVGHYYLGLIARLSGDMSRAEESFTRTLQCDPDHREAKQELRLIELRKAQRSRG